MRLFVAVFPPLKVSEVLARSAAEILAGTSFHPTRPQNVHLTLKFLGDVRPEDLNDISAALTPIGEKHLPFGISTHDFGAFPNPRRARVFWAGVGDGADKLKSLASDVDTTLEPLGFQHETRAYAPHFTLARARRPTRLELDVEPASSTRFTVTDFDLVESSPGELGVIYRPLATYPLRDAVR